MRCSRDGELQQLCNQYEALAGSSPSPSDQVHASVATAVKRNTTKYLDRAALPHVCRSIGCSQETAAAMHDGLHDLNLDEVALLVPSSASEWKAAVALMWL